MTEKLSGKAARESVKNITKRCPGCGAGFIFTYKKRSSKGDAAVAELAQMLGRGEVVITAIEQAEEDFREGRAYVHPLANGEPEAANDRTSAGVKWEDVPEHSRHHAEWIDGRQGAGRSGLPGEEAVPVPAALRALPVLHPDRPRGSKAMLDAHGARARLAEARPGAWLISPFTGCKWAKWPGGDVSWVPKDTELPEVLRVGARDDVQ